MGKICTTTHKFHRGKAFPDGTCLFWSFLFVITPILIKLLDTTTFNEVLMRVLNEGLRMLVTDYIRRHPEMHHRVLSSVIGDENIEKYCSKIEQGELWAGQPELNILSSLYSVLICVIDLTKVTKDKRLLLSYYGQDNPLATECVYIFYNGTNHFDPLYVVNITKPNEITTIFDPNDKTVNDLLRKFIKDELKYNGDVELGVNTVTHVNERSHPTDCSNETEIISNSILPDTPMKPKEKRKESEHGNTLLSSTNDQQLLVSISNEYYIPNKRIKSTEVATDRMSTFAKNNSETMAMKQLLQTDDVLTESDLPVNQQEIVDLPMALNDEEKEPENKSDDGI